jgi:hypothetical protein
MQPKPPAMGHLTQMRIKNMTVKDYGFDPLGNGLYRMVPSGDIVTAEERNRRIPPVDMGAKRAPALIGTLTAEQVQAKQGGKLR